MEQKFDYAKAVEELEKIAAKVEDPATKLDDIDALRHRRARGPEQRAAEGLPGVSAHRAGKD